MYLDLLKFKLEKPKEKTERKAEIIFEDVPGEIKYKYKVVRRLSDGKILKKEKFLNHIVCIGKDNCTFCGDKIN